MSASKLARSLADSPLLASSLCCILSAMMLKRSPLAESAQLLSFWAPACLPGLLRRSPLFVHLLQCLGMRAGKRAHGNGRDVGGRPDVVLQFFFVARLTGLVRARGVARHATVFFLAGEIVFMDEAVVHGMDGGLFVVGQSEKITLRVLRVGRCVGERGFDLAQGTNLRDPNVAILGRERAGFVELGLQTIGHEVFAVALNPILAVGEIL